MICTYVDTLMHEFKVPEAPLSHSQMLQLGDTPLVDKKNKLERCCVVRNSDTRPQDYVCFNPIEISETVFCVLCLF